MPDQHSKTPLQSPILVGIITVSDRATHAWVQDPARNLMEHERLVADVYSVACVGATLIPDYPVGALGEDIHELALAVVPPLGADDDDGACG